VWSGSLNPQPSPLTLHSPTTPAKRPPSPPLTSLQYACQHRSVHLLRVYVQLLVVAAKERGEGVVAAHRSHHLTSLKCDGLLPTIYEDRVCVLSVECVIV